MARYDYSLDVGQSIETDKKIKEMEKKQPQGCCNAPTPPDKVTGDEKQETNEEKLELPESSKFTEPEVQQKPVEEEQLENVPEEKEDTKLKEEDNKEEKLELQKSSKFSEQDVLRKVEIKPVSFEKAKLISDFEQESKEKPKPDAKLEKDAPFEKEPEEDEKDVNEFLEESFNRESKEYEEIQNNKNNKETVIEEPSNRKKWIITAVIIIIAILASSFGYLYFKEPAEPTGAVVTPEMINLTQIMQENVTNETIVEEKNVSVNDILADFTAALED